MNAGRYVTKAISIPKTLYQIWIGPHNPPLPWIESWRAHHPDWHHVLIDTDYLLSRSWRCLPQILEYIRRGRYAGAADLIRYEILYDHGGVFAAADAICLRPLDALFALYPALSHDPLLACCYENEELRRNLCTPYFAATPAHPLLDQALDQLAALDPIELKLPWQSTGNGFLKRLHKETNAIKNGQVIALPSRTFNPIHVSQAHQVLQSGDNAELTAFIESAVAELEKDERVFSLQLWGSTRGTYRLFGDVPQKDEETEIMRAYFERVQSGLERFADEWFEKFSTRS